MSSTRRTIGIAAGVGGVVLLLLIGGAALATRGLPPGTTLAGEPITDPDQVQALAEDLDQRLQLIPVRIVAGSQEAEVAAGDLGVRLDGGGAARTAARSTGLSPWIERMTGGSRLDLDVQVLFASGVASDLAADLSSEPVDGAVRVTAGGLEVTEAVEGITVDASAINDAFRARMSEIVDLDASEWPSTIQIQVSGATARPTITSTSVDSAINRIEELTETPVEVQAEVVPEDSQTVDGVGVPTREEITTTLTSTELIQLLTVVESPTSIERNRLQVQASTDTPPPSLVAFLERAEVAPDLSVEVQDRSPTPSKVTSASPAPAPEAEEAEEEEDPPAEPATTESGSGGPADHPSYGDVSTVTGTLVSEVIEAGLIPDIDQTITAIVQAMQQREPDEVVTVDVRGEEVEEGEAADLGIIEPVSTWTTFYTPGQSRVTNIHKIAEMLDGTLIPPGGNLDINHAVGRRTADKGFVTAGAILEGEFIDDVGGGVSQFATTFFNAMWFSGVDIITHTPHSFWFERYPAAREATIDYPGVNLELNNNTPYWLLVDTAVTADSVTVTFWSTTWFDVQTTMGAREPTSEGFRMKITRRASAPDGVVDDDEFTVNYKLP